MKNSCDYPVEIKVDDTTKILNLAYIDDVCNELIKCLDYKETKSGNYCIVSITYEKSLGKISN